MQTVDLKELEKKAFDTVEFQDERVVVKHAYLERRVTPLDIFLGKSSLEEARPVVIDFGNAIKDLAYSNIFAGDLLLKNFGVTRRGRVVFYDYDEIVPLTQMKFRKMPEARSHMEEMSDEPWFHVGEHDVFPEEFVNFLGFSPTLKKVFMQHHSDLFDARFWKDVQKDIRNGRTRFIPPYRPEHLLGEP